MHFSSILALASPLLVAVNGQIQDLPTTYTPRRADIAAERATARTLSPTSNVKGKSFDRIAQIWLENTDFDMAAGDPSIQWLAKQGVTLTNYDAITHPSQPNYVASVGGQTHWVLLDFWVNIRKSVKTIVDLLESKGVSWSEYQEDMPYSGFTGDFVNQQNGASAYVRKHNPLISYESVNTVSDRLAKIKNFTLFNSDLKSNKLPQWMFITPNMTNDGHDSSITVAGAWAKSFIQPLLQNSNFMNNTLIVLTFDEAENYFARNRVMTILLGDAIPPIFHGKTDNTKYNHYSILKTVEDNWNLGNLGEKDQSAKAFW